MAMMKKKKAMAKKGSYGTPTKKMKMMGGGAMMKKKKAMAKGGAMGMKKKKGYAKGGAARRK